LLDSILKVKQSEDVTKLLTDSNIDYKTKFDTISKNSELKPILSKESLDILIDDVNVLDRIQLNKTYSVACKNKHFLKGLLKNNKKFKEAIENFQKLKFDNPNDATALNNLYLSTEEMIKILKNSNKDSTFSDDFITFNANNFPDELNKKLIKKIELILDKLNNEDKEIMATILNSQKSYGDKLVTI